MPQSVGNFLDDESSPALVDIQRQRVIEKVVARRDLCKHRAHAGSLVIGADAGWLNSHQQLLGEVYLSTATVPTFFITLSSWLAGPAITIVTDCGFRYVCAARCTSAGVIALTRSAR